MITRDITYIDCDLHNNPLRIQFANGNVTQLRLFEFIDLE